MFYRFKNLSKIIAKNEGKPFHVVMQLQIGDEICEYDNIFDLTKASETGLETKHDSKFLLFSKLTVHSNLIKIYPQFEE